MGGRRDHARGRRTTALRGLVLERDASRQRRAPRGRRAGIRPGGALDPRRTRRRLARTRPALPALARGRLRGVRRIVPGRAHRPGVPRRDRNSARVRARAPGVRAQGGRRHRARCRAQHPADRRGAAAHERGAVHTRRPARRAAALGCDAGTDAVALHARGRGRRRRRPRPADAALLPGRRAAGVRRTRARAAGAAPCAPLRPRRRARRDAVDRAQLRPLPRALSARAQQRASVDGKPRVLPSGPGPRVLLHAGVDRRAVRARLGGAGSFVARGRALLARAGGAVDCRRAARVSALCRREARDILGRGSRGRLGRLLPVRLPRARPRLRPVVDRCVHAGSRPPRRGTRCHVPSPRPLARSAADLRAADLLHAGPRRDTRRGAAQRPAPALSRAARRGRRGARRPASVDRHGAVGQTGRFAC